MRLYEKGDPETVSRGTFVHNKNKFADILSHRLFTHRSKLPTGHSMMDVALASHFASTSRAFLRVEGIDIQSSQTWTKSDVQTYE